MEFRVGQITARCVKCEGTVFEEQGREARRGQTMFCCARCKTVTSYSDLILQIGSHRTRERLGQVRSAILAEKAASQAAANEPAADATLIGTTTVPAAAMLIMRGAKASQ